MKTLFKNGITSVVERIKLLDTTSTTGAGKTALTFSSGGLIISTIADNEAAPTVYTSAGSTIETITTLGNFAAPTATKCRFKEVDSTNHPGLYEIQIADARWAVSSARSIIITVQATGAAPQDAEVQLGSVDPYDSVRFGMTALPNANAEAAGGLYTRGAGAGQINQPANGQIDANTVKLSGTSQTARDIGASVLLSAGSGAGQLDFTSGVVKSSLTQILGTALTETAGQIAGGFKKFFNVAAPVLDTTSVNQTGDAYARVGVAGAGLTALGDARIAHLDADTSSRLAPTVAGRTLDVATTGEAGLDFDNIHDASGAHTLTNITVPVATAVTNDVGITQAGADKAWSTAARALTDKAGFALSAAGVQAIWDALTSALTTVGSIGKRIADNLDAAITSRLAAASYLAPDNANIGVLVGRLTNARAVLLDNLSQLDAAISSRLATAGYTVPPTVVQIDTQLSGVHGAGAWGGAGGGGGGTIYGSSGSIAYTYTVTKPGGSIPLAGATVWVSSDLAGVNRSQAQISDALGRVQFSLDPSTVYFWRRHSDWVFVDPDIQVIS